MGNGPAPYSDIGRRARDLLTKDYNVDHKFTFSVPSASGMGLTATGVKRGDIFIGDISTQYKGGNTTVDVKVDTYSNVSTKVTVNDILPSLKAAFSFDIPDSRSGKLDLQYLHNYSAVNSSISLNPNPHLEVSAALGNNDVALGGEIGFNSASSSFTKYNAGISINKPDFAVAVILVDMGQTVKASYIHTVNQSTRTEVAAEMIHRLSSFDNTFTIGSSHGIDPFTTLKTRFSNDGKVGLTCQREWRPKSLVTFSAEYDSKAPNASPKLGLALALKP